MLKGRIAGTSAGAFQRLGLADMLVRRQRIEANDLARQVERQDLHVACLDLRELFPRGSELREGRKTWHFMPWLAVFARVLVRMALR